jgi:hypothetical protein
MNIFNQYAHTMILCTLKRNYVIILKLHYAYSSGQKGYIKLEHWSFLKINLFNYNNNLSGIENNLDYEKNAKSACRGLNF